MIAYVNYVLPVAHMGDVAHVAYEVDETNRRNIG
jgi:hypothetical protein